VLDKAFRQSHKVGIYGRLLVSDKIMKKTADKRTQNQIIPMADRVLVRPLDAEDYSTSTQAGIIIPDTVSKEKPEQGKVVAVGEGRYEDGKLIKPRVFVGDKVLFSKYGYDEIKMDGVEYFILKEDSILAIIK